MDILIQDHIIFPEILWKRPQNIYKRQCGKILIIAGSRGMAGAAALATEAAFRSGVGIVILAFPDAIKEIYKKILPEAMSLELPSTPSGSISIKAYKKIKDNLYDIDVVALGPGLSRNSETVKFILKIINEIKIPLIIDADGLNALVGNPQILVKRQAPTVITPHPGELSRLIKKNTQEINKNRIKIASEPANYFNTITVLKGYETIIAEPKGRIVINKIGGPELATAGTGDVLVGIIATLVSQNLKRIFEATCTAVFLHGLAGKLAKEKIGIRSVIASDIIKFLPKAINLTEKNFNFF